MVGWINRLLDANSKINILNNDVETSVGFRYADPVGISLGRERHRSFWSLGLQGVDARLSIGKGVKAIRRVRSPQGPQS